MSLRFFKVERTEIIPMEDIALQEDKLYIILDTHSKRSTIWIWSGPKSDMMDRYYAGVFATKIKAQKKLYGASIEVVQGGNEPEEFPKLDQLQLVTQIDDKFEELVFNQVNSEVEKEIQDTEATKSREPPNETKAIGKSEIQLKNQITSLLNELIIDIGKIQERIKNFSDKL